MCDFKLHVMTWQFKFVTNFGLIASAKKIIAKAAEMSTPYCLQDHF